MKIIVVFPTRTEAKFFTRKDVGVEFCGVGLSSAAYHTSKIIARHQADYLIMAGIAGVYSHSRLKVGDVVLVGSEREADLGFFTPSGFTHLADLGLEMDFPLQRNWVCPYIDAQMPLPVAHSNSLNAAMAPFAATQDIDLENMEGAAFFQVCLAEQQRFLEVRAISNVAQIGDDDWDFDGSIQQLTHALDQLIDHLQHRELVAAKPIKICPQCAASFTCTSDEQGTPCWCMAYPPVLSVPSRAAECLCPTCLSLAIAAHGERS